MPKKNTNNFKTFSEALNHWADKATQKTFIQDVSTNKGYTYSDFNKLVNGSVILLEELGVKPGDTVSICIRNSSEFLMLYFASIRLGSIINPLPFSLSEEELSKTLDFVQPKLTFLERINSDRVSKTHNTFIVRLYGEDSFSHRVRKYPCEYIMRNLNEDDAACLYYSSGTTANPKGILYSHKNMISLISSICRCFNHTFETIHFGILPMGHTAITNYSFLPVTYAGGSLIFAENFIKIRADFWKIIETYKVSYVEAVPTIVFLILNTKYPDYSREKISLSYIGCGSAPLPSTIQMDFQKRFGIPVANLYGLSETGPTHFDNPLEQNWKPGSIGFPLDVNECKILDDNFNELAFNEVGEIAIKGPNVFIGYYKNEEAYKKAIKNELFLTGDLGYKNKDGRFFYADRKKDLIIKGGVNVYPEEIDEILFKHPSVLAASTIGIPDPMFGEEIVSFVVKKKPVSEAELIKHCLLHLQQLKCPKKIIFIESIPQTYSGKLLRKKLRSLYDEKYKI
jgi:long-chain acyl-CoA synthetase